MEMANPPRHGRRRATLAALSLPMLLAALGTSSANVALPALQAGFGAPFASVQWVVLAYLLTVSSTVVTAGRLGDLFGRRRLLLAGIALFTCASVACATAPSLAMLIAARAMQGLGAALMMALSMALVYDTVAKEQAGTAMGLLGTMSALGTALGPSLGGALLDQFGWQAVFLINVPVGLAALCLACRYLPRIETPAQRQGVDWLGMLLLAATLSGYAYAMTSGHAVLLLAAASGLVLLIAHAKRAAAPLIPLSLLRTRSIGAACAMSALVTTVVMATLVIGPFYLGGALHLRAAQTGLVMACGPLVAALAGIPAGRLVDRLGSGRIVLLGLAIMLCGCVAMLASPMLYPVASYVGAIAILTAGYALFQAANNTAVMAQVQAEQKGVASGLLNLARNLGLISGASLMGALYALGKNASEGMQYGIAGAAGLTAAALALAIAGRPAIKAAAHTVHAGRS